jgi:hypothetical protein
MSEGAEARKPELLLETAGAGPRKPPGRTAIGTDTPGRKPQPAKSPPRQTFQVFRYCVIAAILVSLLFTVVVPALYLW